ncbi:MAG: DNA methyltransferase [Rhodobacteraceae bacterium]|nr:DNA methyltransferase [Paracoccaceae bacterium]MCY4326898.1 DNA methyltransferase [Paracoccaceae bacterium]
MNVATTRTRWPLGSAEGRWKGFGPYYAMFPVSFAEQYIEQYSRCGDTIIDPFCGRGTSNYIANLLGRNSIGCDVNPVAWIYSKTKTDPAKQLARLYRRVDEIWSSRHLSDYQPDNEFQTFAWSSDVLAFLKSARRQLDWRKSKVDWTLTGIILVYLHGKSGGGLSNQMRQSKSMAPDYAVRWWKERGMIPPALDPVEFIKKRIRWRYDKGLCALTGKSRIFLGDARTKLNQVQNVRANLLITSPPYCGITNYEYDNWIRLWFLNGPALPRGQQPQRYANKPRYKDMINSVFTEARNLMTDNACLVVRIDRRAFTLMTTVNTLHALWPSHQLLGQASTADKPTQTELFGDKTVKPGDVDILVLPKGRPIPKGFLDIQALSND